MHSNEMTLAEVCDETETTGALFVFAAGFEERSLSVVRRMRLEAVSVLLVRYVGNVPENDRSFEEAAKLLKAAGVASVHTVALSIGNASRFPEEVLAELRRIKIGDGEVWVDVSGLPMFGICAVLWAVRQAHPLRKTRIFYTEAEDYFPTEAEFREVEDKVRGMDIDALEPAMSTEMGRNLVLEPFRGVNEAGRKCLIVYVGYEKLRSEGVVDEMNPHRLVYIFGEPGREDLRWRVRMSKAVHEVSLAQRPTAREVVSTLEVEANLDLLFCYYEALYDDHDLAVAPVCSKMQTVAAYLFWERFRDVQLVFPLPVRYLPGRFSKGEGRTFHMLLPYPPGIAAMLKAGDEDPAAPNARGS